MSETNGRNPFAKFGVVPWLIAAISLTWAISDRVNAPNKDIAALDTKLGRIEEQVKSVQKSVDEVKVDLKDHVRSGK